MRQVVALPRGRAPRDIVQVVVSAEDDVDAVLVVDWVDLLRGGGRRGQGLRELDVLHEQALVVDLLSALRSQGVGHTFGTLPQRQQRSGNVSTNDEPCVR